MSDGTAATRAGSEVARVGVVGRGGSTELPSVLRRLESFLEDRGRILVAEAPLHAHVSEAASELSVHSDPPDLVVSLGGDGTLLRAARLVIGKGIPVLGVNLGRLGFLTAVGADEMEEALDRFFAGDCIHDLRRTLEARIERSDGSAVETFAALNDVVVHKEGLARVTRLGLYVEEGEGRVEELGVFSGDGMILATPTGSTAYSLSAGGPIVVPTLECMLVTPICPHSLAVRPMVIPPYEEVTVRALDPLDPLSITIDGQVARELRRGDVVVVRQGEAALPLVRFPGQSFFSTLRRKLNWGARGDREATEVSGE